MNSSAQRGIIGGVVLAAIGFYLAYGFNVFGIPYTYYGSLLSVIGTVMFGSVGFKIGYNSHGDKPTEGKWPLVNRWLGIMPGIGGLCVTLIMAFRNFSTGIVFIVFALSAVALFIAWEK